MKGLTDMKRLVKTVFVDFGDVLRYYRTKEGLSQEQLADNICSREYISLIEKGKKIPTLYMVDAFSKKMGINLFDAYALVIEHNDFDTHLRIEELNDAINARNDDRLYQLAVEYAKLPGFSYGVPYQCIKHALSLYYANVSCDYEKAVQYASEGLAVSGLTNLAGKAPLPVSNLDICLLTAKAVALCRGGWHSEGRITFEYLRECVKLRFVQNLYVANRNRRFDIRMFAMTAFNICEFFPNDCENNLKMLEDSIRILNRYECSSKQPELLLYKARYLFDTGEHTAAVHCFNAGYYMLLCGSSAEEAVKTAQEIMQERFEKLVSI